MHTLLTEYHTAFFDQKFKKIFLSYNSPIITNIQTSKT